MSHAPQFRPNAAPGGPRSKTQSIIPGRTLAAPARAVRSAAVVAVTMFGLVGLASLVAARGAASFDQSTAATALAAICGVLALVTMTAWRRAIEQLPRRARSGSQLGPYTIGRPIGEGGMGVVYEARHEYLERPAAVKVLRPERASGTDAARFEREVQRTSRLAHPNTIRIYDFGRADDGSFYYAMEYVDGLDLQALVERSGPQDPARVAHLLAQLSGALAEAHAMGIVHRDVKPANVMVCERAGAHDVVKVLDFGLSQELDEGGDEGAGDDDAQYVVGTPLYLAPEALIGGEKIDGRSDLYALGALGYFLLTGTTPFAGQSLLEMCGHHLHTLPEPPSSRTGAPIPRPLEKLILSCLAKSPGERPASAAELRRSLLALAAAWTEERAARWWEEHRHAPRDASRPASATVNESNTRAIAA